MSLPLKKVSHLFAGVLAVGLLSPASPVFAQGTPPQSGTSSSVLPTGGGAALLDPSDTVFLLLDHQSGLFQTVKDIPIAGVAIECRDACEAGDAREDSRQHPS